MAVRLSCKSYVCDPRPGYPLVITAKRYWDPQSAYLHDSNAATLVFTHGTGYHKEQWEPTIADLYDRAGREERPSIREVWSIDSPNAGDAAVLNEKALLYGYDVFDWGEYASAVHIFLAGLGTGVEVDFFQHRLVAVGHSMGAIAMILATTYAPKVTFSSILLVDPLLIPPGTPEAGAKVRAALVPPTQKRRDVWSSRDEAYESFKSRKAFQVWDPRVLKTYIDHGLRDLPTAYYTDKTGVTLKYSKAQEIASYIAYLGRIRAYEYLPFLCEHVPVHFIHGAISDVLPQETKDHVLHVQTKGKFASAQTVEGAGHLVPQMQPRGLADAIWNVLSGDTQRQTVSRSKL